MVREALTCPRGATFNEMLTLLVVRFPDRDPRKTRATISAAANAFCTSKKYEIGRGTVYLCKIKDEQAA
jgi:hypothetical protein